eukprot:m.75516 g.75516  ORF g.75516 m.75516 type:complete len:287 (+) comp9003_c0_seq1:117-977(+)
MGSWLSWLGGAVVTKLARWNAKHSLRDHGVTYTADDWKNTVSEASVEEQHALWTGCLARHTDRARIRGIDTVVVDYHAMHHDPHFTEYLNQLADMPTPSNPAEHLAFLLNGYNALCIKVVAAAVVSGRLQGERASIRDLGSALSPIWKQTVGILGGNEVSLDLVEHGHVRSIFKDARAHACLNCASVGCPDLASRAFEAQTLDTMMDERVTRWLSNETKGVCVDNEGTVVQLSMIFRWFDRDFLREVPTGASILDWIKAHGGSIGSSESPPHIEYREYDWGLNGKP